MLSTIKDPDADPETLAWAADALGTDVANVPHYDADRFDPKDINHILGSL